MHVISVRNDGSETVSYMLVNGDRKTNTISATFHPSASRALVPPSKKYWKTKVPRVSKRSYICVAHTSHAVKVETWCMKMIFNH
jgi:hypothetical protein